MSNITTEQHSKLTLTNVCLCVITSLVYLVCFFYYTYFFLSVSWFNEKLSLSEKLSLRFTHANFNVIVIIISDR